MKDKLTITIKLERNINGTITKDYRIEGEGFHYFEIIGMLEIMKSNLVTKSIETGVEIEKDVPTRLKFVKDDSPKGVD